MNNICVIYNKDSGLKDNLLKIKSALNKIGLQAEYVPLDKMFEKKLNGLYKRGFRLFVAAGGDGTVNAVASLVIKLDGATLGVIPNGTLNHFAKDVGIPVDTHEAVALLRSPVIKKIDAGCVNGQLFLNNSSIGMYARIARQRQRHNLWAAKWLRALLSGIRLVASPPAYGLKLSIDGRDMRRRSPLVFVGNNKYDLSKRGFSNRTSLESGNLCVYLFATRNPLRLVTIGILILLGRYQVSGFEEFDTSAVIIGSSRKSILVSYDGEVRKMHTPLKYEVLPKSLRVAATK